MVSLSSRERVSSYAAFEVLGIGSLLLRVIRKSDKVSFLKVNR